MILGGRVKELRRYAPYPPRRVPSRSSTPTTARPTRQRSGRLRSEKTTTHESLFQNAVRSPKRHRCNTQYLSLRVGQVQRVRLIGPRHFAEPSYPPGRVWADQSIPASTLGNCAKSGVASVEPTSSSHRLCYLV